MTTKNINFKLKLNFFDLYLQSNIITHSNFKFKKIKLFLHTSVIIFNKIEYYDLSIKILY